MAVSCAAIPETLIESELFGYEKGAFTGAMSRRQGLFEAADKSTLFLDEIGELNVNMQSKVLRALQEREIRRVGSHESIKVDVRIIAATNKNLEEEVSKGDVPGGSLLPAERGHDSSPAAAGAEHGYPAAGGILRAAGLRGGRSAADADHDGGHAAAPALPLARQCATTGGRSAAGGPALGRAEDRLHRPARSKFGSPTLPSREPEAAGARRERIAFSCPRDGIDLEAVERDFILQAMEQSGWVIAKAAKLLGLSYRTLQYRLEKFQIRRDGSEGVGSAEEQPGEADAGPRERVTVRFWS